MTHKHIKKELNLIKEMQIKITMSYHYTHTRMKKKKKIASVGSNVGELEHSYTECYPIQSIWRTLR